jgi:hypothetical protein
VWHCGRVSGNPNSHVVAFGGADNVIIAGICAYVCRVRFWINNEPCGLICGCITYVLILYGQFAASVYIIAPWLGVATLLGAPNLFLFNAVSVVAMYSHYKGTSMEQFVEHCNHLRLQTDAAMTTDPGAVPRNAKPTPDDQMEIDYEANERWNGDSNT